MKFLRDNRGFSLVEILAAVVILGLVATTFFQLFVFSQKTTSSSQEKLVAINIAQGVLERINYGLYPELLNEENLLVQNTFSSSFCTSLADPELKGECEGKYQMTVNNVEYYIVINVDNQLQKDVGIKKVVINVNDKDGKTYSSVEGYVNYE